MRFRIVPYKRGSASAKLLAQTLSNLLGYRVWRGAAKPRRMNISWGFGNVGRVAMTNFINRPDTVLHAQNKILTFQALENAGVRHVPYTTSKETAKIWQDGGSIVFARTPAGQGGYGITVVQPDETLPDLPLYTQYIRKQKEFRVHVVKGSVIDVQQKKKREGVEVKPYIRNHANGWIYAHEGVTEPVELRELGVAAVRALGLDFGAVDIIWNERRNLCYVLEVNTAPGLSQTTAVKYGEYLTHEEA